MNFLHKDSFDSFDILTDDILIEEVGGHIQANLQDEIVREALKSGVDLREYSNRVKDELNDIEKLSVQDYIDQRDKVIELHQQIVSSDAILKRMEDILLNFHKDLGSISSDIQSLQQKSLYMHQCLQNRQIIRGELCQFMAEMVVPEQMINHILETPVTDRYFVEELHELDHKLKFVAEQSFQDSKSAHDVSEILEQLKVKAVLKIREYLMQKIYSFKKPMTNFQVPQDMMLKYRFFNEFLLAHDRTVASEINQEYLDTTSKIYYSYFKTYLTKLMKLQFDRSADKEDLLGKEENAAMRRVNTTATSIFSSQSTSSNNLKNKSTVFSLAQRDLILNPGALEEPIILPHAVLANQKSDNKMGYSKKFTFETLFRSQHYALMDNSCREYLFLCDFFMLSPGSSNSQDMFNVVMGKTVNYFHKQMETYVASCYDAIAMLLCIRIVDWYRDVCHERGVFALDNYWTLLLKMLWPRWYNIMDAHINSLRQHHAVPLDKPLYGSGNMVHRLGGTSTSSSSSILSGSSSSSGNIAGGGGGGGDVRPYSVTRQYAEFCSALHSILRRRTSSNDTFSNIYDNSTSAASVSITGTTGTTSTTSTNINTNTSSGSGGGAGMTGGAAAKPFISTTTEIFSRMTRLQVELESMLVRIADSLKTNKDRITFFINNCDLILSVLTENNVSDCVEAIKFKEVMGEKIKEYVEEVLLPYFGSLIHFIKDTEVNHSKNQRSEYTPSEEMKVQKIIKGFNIDWKNSVEKINSEILTSFTNFCIGTQIFQAVVSQLIQYYRRLQSCMNMAPFKNMPVKSEMVNIHHIMVEMKKFKPNF